MVWKECMPVPCYKFICNEENFIYLNGKNVLQPKVSEIIYSYRKWKYFLPKFQYE